MYLPHGRRQITLSFDMKTKMKIKSISTSGMDMVSAMRYKNLLAVSSTSVFLLLV